MPIRGPSGVKGIGLMPTEQERGGGYVPDWGDNSGMSRAEPRYDWLVDGPGLYLIVIGIVLSIVIVSFLFMPVETEFRSFMSKCVLEQSAQRCNEIYYWTER